MIEKVKELVFELLDKDNSGHGNDHIQRVLDLSLKFAEKENANKEIVSLIALLHDVDDYKLFGKENSEKYNNAINIMNQANIPIEIQNRVINELKNIGFSRALKGLRPNSIEGKIVSDADMCDALGVNGVIRTHKYSVKNGKPFFDKNIFPIDNITSDKYTRKCADSSVCHIFEKVLTLRNLMLTNSGKEVANKRHEVVVNILYNLFEEENAMEWKKYLDNFLLHN